MRWPFVSRSRHAAALSEIESLRRRVLATEARHDEAEGERRLLADRLAEAKAANTRLHGRNVHLTEQLERAREAAQDGALDEMGGRLDRALRACARYRADADGQARLIRNQNGLLDQFYGLDTPAIAAGEQWQQRRHDKISGVTR